MPHSPIASPGHLPEYTQIHDAIPRRAGEGRMRSRLACHHAALGRPVPSRAVGLATWHGRGSPGGFTRSAGHAITQPSASALAAPEPGWRPPEEAS